MFRVLIRMTGNLFSLSYVTMRSILSFPDIPELTLLELWHTVFFRGFYACPTLGFFTSGLSALNALLTYGDEVWSTGSWSPSPLVYAILISGLFLFGMVPYTIQWVVPLSEELLKRERERAEKIRAKTEKDGKSLDDSQSDRASLDETRKKLERWVALNYGRMVIPFIGVAVAWTIY